MPRIRGRRTGLLQRLPQQQTQARRSHRCGGCHARPREGLRPAHFRAGQSTSGGACASTRSASIACRTCTLNASSVSVRSPATATPGVSLFAFARAPDHL